MATSTDDARVSSRQQESDADYAARMQHLAKTMFDRVGRYLDAEVRATAGDYKLLEKLNTAAAHKYQVTIGQAKALVKHAQGLDDKYEQLKPQLAQIDDLCTSVEQLEQVVKELDVFSAGLEAQFKRVHAVK